MDSPNDKISFMSTSQDRTRASMWNATIQGSLAIHNSYRSRDLSENSPRRSSGNEKLETVT